MYAAPRSSGRILVSRLPKRDKAKNSPANLAFHGWITDDGSALTKKCRGVRLIDVQKIELMHAAHPEKCGIVREQRSRRTVIGSDAVLDRVRAADDIVIQLSDISRAYHKREEKEWKVFFPFPYVEIFSSFFTRVQVRDPAKTGATRDRRRFSKMPKQKCLTV